MTEAAAAPGELAYLYMGTDDVDASLALHTEALGAPCRAPPDAQLPADLVRV